MKKLRRLTKPLCKAFITTARNELLRMGAVEKKDGIFNGGSFYLETKYGLIDFNVHAESGRLLADIFARFKDPSIARLAGLSVDLTNNKYNHHFERDDIEFWIEKNRLNQHIRTVFSSIDPILNGVTEQWIFNIVSKHLLTQKTQSIKNGHCQYLCSDGKKCAIGCLIPNYLYNPIFEGLIFVDKFITDKQSDIILSNESRLYEFSKVFIKLGYKNEHLKLLRALQNVHDDHNVNEWEKNLRKLPKNHEVTCNF